MLTIKLTLWRQLGLQLILLFLTGCSSGFERNCPNTLNVSWQNLPATIRIDNLTSGESVVLDRAIQDWNDALGREYLRLDSGSRNLIMDGGSTFKEREQGKTTSRWMGSNLTSADIYINVPISRNIDLESLYVHELGHFLGLDHISGTVMNPELPEYVRRIEIQQKVIDSAKCLYENR